MKEKLLVSIILLAAVATRFFNLMQDTPYFFNPDERNMAIAIIQFRLPKNPIRIPMCLVNEFGGNNRLGKNDCNLNPHFFAYSQFPLYLSFASDQIVRMFVGNRENQSIIIENFGYLSTSVTGAIYYLRVWSAVASVLSVYLVFKITKQVVRNLFNPANIPDQLSPLTSIIGLIPLFSASLAVFLPGLIQSSHFGTTEAILTFFFLASVYFSMQLVNRQARKDAKGYLNAHYRPILASSLAVGLALASKLTGLFFLFPPLSALFLNMLMLKRNRNKSYLSSSLFYVILMVAFTALSLVFAAIFSPYNLIERESFKNAVFGYESDVATGKYDAFYTVQFKNTLPIVFQAQKVFPYALGWPAFILGTIGFAGMVFSCIRLLFHLALAKMKHSRFKMQNYNEKCKFFNFDLSFFILIFSFSVYFIPNAFLYAKWTRFMAPIFPFFHIFTGYLLGIIVRSANRKFLNFNMSFCVLIFAFCIFCILPGIAFISIYAHEDSRVTASRWIYQNIPNDSYILSETANVVDIPLGISGPEPYLSNRYTVVSFDFYHLDENPALFDQLVSHLEKADYILIPSRRLFKNYLRLPQKYPILNKYYSNLFSGSLGFEKVQETASYPSIGRGKYKVAFPDEDAEETFTVFDHPVIRIYKKVKQYPEDVYLRMLMK